MPPKKTVASAQVGSSSAGALNNGKTETEGTAAAALNPATGSTPPSELPIERVDDSILNASDPDAYTMEIDPEEHLDPSSSSTVRSTEAHDAPGPSSTYIPRSPSPPLPNLRSEHFPPEWDDGDDDGMSSDDDEVLATLPIYLSPALHPHLHLFQYPLHTQSLVAPSYARDRGKEIAARVKEKAGRIEVEIPVDAGVDVWRDDRAREFGMTHDMGNGDVVGGYGFGGRGDEDAAGRKKKSKAKEEKRWGDKIRLRSEALPSTTGYYAGVVKDGALHLHPLSKIQQMRTALNYLDDYDEKNRSRKGRMNDDDDEEKEDKKPKPAAQGPPIRALRKEDDEGDGSGSIKDFRTKMWRLAREEAEDNWVEYQWRRDGDEQVTEALEKLYIAEDKKVRLTCTTKGLDYLDAAV